MPRARLAPALTIAVALVLALLAGPAFALSVTAPRSATLPKANPLTVQWSSPGPGVIDIRLIRLTPTGYTFADLAMGIPNTGQAVVRFPEDASCDPAHSYRLRVVRRATTGTPISWLDQGESVPFRLTCDPGPRPDQITVINRIVNNTTFPTPAVTFDVMVVCSPSGVRTNVQLSAPSHLQKVIPVPFGSACSLTELTPPVPRPPCAWLVTYPLGRHSRPGGALTVVNELKCDGGLDRGEPDLLRIMKRVINASGAPLTGLDFQVRVDCAPIGPHTTITLSPPGDPQRILPVPADSQCEIAELPSRAPVGCDWITTYPNGTRLRGGGALMVINDLRCKAVRGP